MVSSECRGRVSIAFNGSGRIFRNVVTACVMYIIQTPMNALPEPDIKIC